ncbi:MAG: elongation factor P, partial [Bacteroidales bacterium]|nr:elongation factor P [Bacteroidales bacterium]
FEQISIEENLITNPQFLKDGCIVDILIHSETETPLTCELPAYMDFEVTYTEPGEKGNTATNATKEAILDTGAKIRVPLFINTGEKIKVDTRSGEYSSRA